MRLRVLVTVLTLSLFVGFATLVSLLSIVLERKQCVGNLHLEARAISAVLSEHLKHAGLDALESRQAHLERALSASLARSVFLVTEDLSRPLAIWRDPPPASLLNRSASTRTSRWSGFGLFLTPRVEVEETLYLALGAEPSGPWFALISAVDPADPHTLRIGVVLKADAAARSVQQQWQRAQLMIPGAALLGMLVALFLNRILERDLMRVERRVQARIKPRGATRIEALAQPRIREFFELDVAVGLVERLERRSIAREYARTPIEDLVKRARTQRRLLQPRITRHCCHWDILTTLSGQAAGAFHVQHVHDGALYVILGHTSSDEQACNAATWWTRTLAQVPLGSQAWLSETRARCIDCFGPDTRIWIERFPHPFGLHSQSRNTLICKGVLDPRDEALIQQWCISAMPGCQPQELADELDALLNASDRQGGAVLIARFAAHEPKASGPA